MNRPVPIALAFVSAVFVATPQVSAAANVNRLLAPPVVCPHQSDAGDPAPVQEQAMSCMTDYARERTGLRGLEEVAPLERSARRKSVDIVRCDSFSHTACGREFVYWIRRFGYRSTSCWSAAENIAWGSGSFATVRSIFRSWMESPGHRANILGAEYTDLGVGLKVGTLDGHQGAHVWTQHFAARCRVAPA